MNDQIERHWINGVARAGIELGVSADTVRNMIKRGDLYAERVGPRLIRVDLNSVQVTPLGPDEDAA